MRNNEMEKGSEPQFSNPKQSDKFSSGAIILKQVSMKVSQWMKW